MTFEDNVSCFPYQLLQGCVTDLRGSKGNRNLYKFIQDNNIRNDVIYVDVSPDNVATVSVYFQVLKTEKTHNNIVLPIPCIEYEFLRAFVGYATPESDILLRFDDYRKLQRVYRGKLLKKFRNYETCCKVVVSALSACIKTDFVLYDCICPKEGNTLCKGLSLLSKERRLLRCLPAVDYAHAQQTKKDCIDVYNRMGNSFTECGIISGFCKLPVCTWSSR